MAENWIGIGAKFNGKQAIDGITKLQKSFAQLKRVAMLAIGGKIIKDISAFGREMNMMAERTGMSVARLSSLRNAFISAGSGAKGFESTINNITNGLQGLMIGRGEFAAKLSMFGISPYTAGGQVKDEEQILYEIANWAKSQKGRMSKQQILYQLSSILGIDTQMGEKMLEGGEAFRKLQKDASERMGEIDKDVTDKLDNIKTRWDEFSGTVGNTSDKVVASMEKPLSKILEWSQDLAKFAGDNPKTTATVVGISGLATALGTLGGAVYGAATGIGVLAGAFVGLAGALGGLLALVAGGGLGFGLGYLGTAFVNLFRGGGDYRKHLKDYMINETTMDMKRLEKDFWAGKLDQNDFQRIAAIFALHNYNPEKYAKFWEEINTVNDDRRMLHNMLNIEEPDIPNGVETSSVTNTSNGDTNNDIDIKVEIVSGDSGLTEADYDDIGYGIGYKIAEAITLKVPAQQSAT